MGSKFIGLVFELLLYQVKGGIWIMDLADIQILDIFPEFKLSIFIE